MYKIAVLVSGGGSNLQSIIDNIDSGYLNCTIDIVIADRQCYGIERAKKAGIDIAILDRKIYKDQISTEISKLLKERVDLIVLAGWLSILKGELLREYSNKIINIHPSLIPSFCGSGMFGIKVHEKVIEYGVKASGCTVHFVDENTDAGPIILQRVVPVFFKDSPQNLQERILVQEHIALPEAIKYISENKVKIIGRRVEVEL